MNEGRTQEEVEALATRVLGKGAVVEMSYVKYPATKNIRCQVKPPDHTRWRPGTDRWLALVEFGSTQSDARDAMYERLLRIHARWMALRDLGMA